MIHEAEVFLQADEFAARVFTAICGEQWQLVLPPVFDMAGADQPLPLHRAVNHYAYDNAWVPDLLAGRTMDEVGRDRYDGDLLGTDPAASIRRISAAAAHAARLVEEPTRPVHCSYGDCPAAEYFWQLNIARTLTAHDVAQLLGLDVRLPPSLCRAMFEGTSPGAQMWRSFGIYRAPLDVPAGASWPDRYLALTGRSAPAERSAAQRSDTERVG